MKHGNINWVVVYFMTLILYYKITGASVICANNTIYIAGGNDGASNHYKQVWKLEF